MPRIMMRHFSASFGCSQFFQRLFGFVGCWLQIFWTGGPEFTSFTYVALASGRLGEGDPGTSKRGGLNRSLRILQWYWRNILYPNHMGSASKASANNCRHETSGASTLRVMEQWHTWNLSKDFEKLTTTVVGQGYKRASWGRKECKNDNFLILLYWELLAEQPWDSLKYSIDCCPSNALRLEKCRVRQKNNENGLHAFKLRCLILEISLKL